MPEQCIRKSLLSHWRMRLAYRLQFLNKMDLCFPGPYSARFQTFLCNYEAQKPKYRSTIRPTYLSGYSTDYFRSRAWLPTQSAAKLQSNFLTAPLRRWRGKGVSDPSPAWLRCAASKPRGSKWGRWRQGKVKTGNRETRAQGLRPAHSFQASWEVITDFFFNPSSTRDCKMLDTLTKMTDVTQDCVAQSHLDHHIFSPGHTKHATAWGTTDRRWPLRG